MIIFLLKKLGDMKIIAIFVSGYVADRDGEIRLEVDEEKGVELLGQSEWNNNIGGEGEK